MEKKEKRSKRTDGGGVLNRIRSLKEAYCSIIMETRVKSGGEASRTGG